MAENPKLKTLREKAMKLPLTPGVYIMKNKDKKITKMAIFRTKSAKKYPSMLFPISRLGI